MSFTSTQDYTGFSFAEKKVFKEKEEQKLVPAQKNIHDKLGTNGSLPLTGRNSLR